MKDPHRATNADGREEKEEKYGKEGEGQGGGGHRGRGRGRGAAAWLISTGGFSGHSV